MSRAFLTWGLTAIALLLMPISAGRAAPPATGQLTIAAGPAGAELLPLGEGLARLISANVANASAKAESTPGFVDAAQRLGDGRAQLAFLNAAVARLAVRGEGAFAPTRIAVRTLTPLFEAYLHLVTLEGTGIDAFGDLRGKRVSIGPPGAGYRIIALALFKAAGIDPERDLRAEPLTVADAARALRERRIDALFWLGRLPGPVILELAATPGVSMKLISLDSVLPALQREQGNAYLRVIIPRAFYPGLVADVPTVGEVFLLVAREDLNLELAYQITRLVFEQRAELTKTHRDAQHITLIGAAQRSPIPFHPGAARYFRERGIEGF